MANLSESLFRDKFNKQMDTKLIVGLGNPGREYTFTRHNIGFRILENWLNNLSITIPDCPCQLSDNKKHQAKTTKIKIKDQNVILAEPTTYMNNSGLAVKSLADYYNLQTEDILIIHDDLSFPLGKFKLDFQAGPAGHNGVKSIINHLQTQNFYRLRIGIAKPMGSCPVNHQGGHDFVLGKFTSEEEELIADLLSTTVDLLNYYLAHGPSATQNKFNGR